MNPPSEHSPPSEKPPLSHPVSVREIGDATVNVVFTATPAECRALAASLSVLSVEALSAHFALRGRRDERVMVEGHVSAKVVQACVLSLEPVPAALEEDVDITFAPPAWFQRRPAEPEVDLDAFGEDPPDLLEGDILDLGALAAEFVALGLDPYPRAPGVSFTEVDTDPDGAPEKPSPFAALKRLKPDGN